MEQQDYTDMEYHEKSTTFSKREQQGTVDIIGFGDTCKVSRIVLELEYKRNKIEDAYLRWGDAYMFTNEIQMAIECYQKALEIGKELEDKRQERYSYLGLGLSYRLNEQFRTAIEYFLEALKLSKKREQNGEETVTNFGLGDAYSIILNDQFQTSINYYEKALNLANEREDKRQQTLAYIGLGDIYILKKEIKTAIEYYEMAFVIANEKEEKHEETKEYFSWGVTYSTEEQFQIKIESYENSVVNAEKRKDEQQKIDAYLGLGDIYSLNNKFQKAIVFYVKALEISEQRENKRQETEAYLGLGVAYRMNNEFETAIECYKKCLKIARKQEDKHHEAEACFGLGDAYGVSNQFEKAIEYFEKAFKIPMKGLDEKDEIQRYLLYGDAYKLQNNVQVAIEYYIKASEISKDQENKQEVIQWRVLQEIQICLASSKIIDLTQPILSAKILSSITAIVKSYFTPAQTIPFWQQTSSIEIPDQNEEKDSERDAKIEESEKTTDLDKDAKNQVSEKIADLDEEKYSKRDENAQESEQTADQNEVNNLEHDAKAQESEQTADQNEEKNSEKDAKAQKLEQTAGLNEEKYSERDEKAQEKEQTADSDNDAKTQESEQTADQNEEKNSEKDAKAQELEQTAGLNEEKYSERDEKAQEKEQTADSDNDAKTPESEQTADSDNDAKTQESEQTADQNEEKSSVKDTKIQESEHIAGKGSSQNFSIDQEFCMKQVDVKKEEHVDEATFFETTFLNSEYSIREDVHKIFKSFSWLTGGYGVSGPNPKFPRPHLYLTVKRGKKKSKVLKKLQNVFKCDPLKYFELYRESETKFKYLSTPKSGGSIVAVSKDDVLCHTRLLDKDVDEELSNRVSGTLTMFCFHEGNHYALTCFHVGCCTDEANFRRAFNQEQLLDIQTNMEGCEMYAREYQEYYYKEKEIDSPDVNDNPKTRASCSRLGEFSNRSFNSESDIMSIQVPKDVKIHCNLAGIDFPDWERMRKELYQRIVRIYDICDRVEVYPWNSENKPTGHIVRFSHSHKCKGKLLFQDAIAIKGNCERFLRDGDSGTLICFLDENNRKQAFAYGVCEVDELDHNEMSSDEDRDNGSERSTSYEDSSDDSDYGQNNANIKVTSSEGCGAAATECKSLDGDESDADKKRTSARTSVEGCSTAATQCEKLAEEKGVSDDGRTRANTSDEWKNGNKHHSDEDSFEFFEESGPFAICLKLNTALENLELSNAGCFGECRGSN